MTTAEKDAFADEAYKALDHPLVERVIDELCGNLRVSNRGLPRYGIRKVAHYAAIVARAHALGIDPDTLRATDDEADEAAARLVRAAIESGKPVFVVTTEADDAETGEKSA